jgi:hypothetical protein
MKHILADRTIVGARDGDAADVVQRRVQRA